MTFWGVLAARSGAGLDFFGRPPKAPSAPLRRGLPSPGRGGFGGGAPQQDKTRLFYIFLKMNLNACKNILKLIRKNRLYMYI